MVDPDPVNHYCSSIQKIIEGGAKLTTPRGHEGLTSDMKGRWTISAFDTKHKNKKETPPIKESTSEYTPLIKKDDDKKFVSVCAWCDADKHLSKKFDDAGWKVSHGMCKKHFEDQVAELTEALYPNNAGVMEVFKFFEKATDEEKKQFDDLVNKGNQNAALRLIEKVLGIKFQGDLTLERKS